MYHLVTGACGYVGSNIVEELVKQGFKVISLDILKNDRIKNISKFYKIDVSNFDELDDKMEECFALKDRVVFMDINVDRNEHVYPMLIAPNGSMKDMKLSKTERT